MVWCDFIRLTVVIKAAAYNSRGVVEGGNFVEVVGCEKEAEEEVYWCC